MNKSEVARLLVEIKKNYPSFEASAESVDRHLKYLHDIPFAVAQQNLDSHILTERFPPTISDLRGRLGEQKDREQSKIQTESYFAQVDLWKRNAAPPPDGYFEYMREKLRGGQA